MSLPTKSPTSPALRIIVASREQGMPDPFAAILPRIGHKLVSIVATGRELVEKCRAHQPDLVIAEVGLSDMDVVAAARAVAAERPVPFIVLTHRDQPEPITISADSRIFATLARPVAAAQLDVQIALVMWWSEQMESMRRQIGAFQQNHLPIDE